MFTYDGELDISGSSLRAKIVDILHPFVVLLEAIGRDTDHLDVASCEIRGTASNFSELGGADWGKVSWMGEQNCLEIVGSLGHLRPLKVKILTQESPIQSWNLMGPAVVSASKSGAMSPRRRDLCAAAIDGMGDLLRR